MIINALVILVEAFVQMVVSKEDQLHMLGGPKVKAPPSTRLMMSKFFMYIYKDNYATTFTYNTILE